MPDRRVRGIVLGGYELYILVSQPEIVDRLLNQIGILVAHVPEFGGGNAHEKNSVADVAVTGWLQPGVVGVAIDFLFQRIEDARPRIRNDGGTGRLTFYEYQIPSR